MTRLSELLSFALPALLRGSTTSALRRMQSSSAAAATGGVRITQRDLLRPVAGTLTALWQAEQREQGKEAEDTVQQLEGSKPTAAVLAAASAAPPEEGGGQVLQPPLPLRQRGPVLHSVVAALAALPSVTEAHWSQLSGLDWGPAAAMATGQDQLALLHACIGDVLERRRQVEASVAAVGGGGAGGPALEEAPSEFLDPIMCTLMQVGGGLWGSFVEMPRAAAPQAHPVEPGKGTLVD